MIPGKTISLENLDNLVKQHMAFLIRTVSNFTGRYVSIENDEEFSIALLAFTEAVKRYDKEKGTFLTFAKLVIESRLKTYLMSKKKDGKEVSMESMQEEGMDFTEEKKEEDHQSLHEEIIQYREELLIFGLTLEILVDHAPKHEDTRKTAVRVAETASEDEDTVQETYRKKRNWKSTNRKKRRMSSQNTKPKKMMILNPGKNQNPRIPMKQKRKIRKIRRKVIHV